MFSFCKRATVPCTVAVALYMTIASPAGWPADGQLPARNPGVEIADGMTESGAQTMITCYPSADKNFGEVPVTVNFKEDYASLDQWEWDFADGATASGRFVSHTYTVPGSYHWIFKGYRNGSLQCTEDGWFSANASCTIACTPVVPTTGPAKTPIQFSAEYVLDKCQGDATFEWTFGDGGTSAEQSPLHTYDSSGSKNWSLRVGNTLPFKQYCVKGGSINITGCPALACEATVPAFAAINASVAFKATVTATGCTGSKVFDWDFGDGTAHSNQQNPSHTYTKSGELTWTFKVTVDGTTCTQTGKIIVGCLKVGDLLFCADTVTTVGSETRLSGNANVSGMVWFSGDATFIGDPALGLGTVSTDGNVFVKLKSANETLFSGPSLTLEVDGASKTLVLSTADPMARFNSTLSMIPLYAKGTPVKIGSDKVTITPTVFIGIPGVFTLASWEATIDYPKGGDKQLVGARLIEGQLVPSIQFLDINFTYKAAEDKLEGSCSVGFPFIGPSAKLVVRIKSGCFNGFDLTSSIESFPLGTTGISIRQATVSIDNICDLPKFLILLMGNLKLAVVPYQVFDIQQVGAGYQAPYKAILRGGTARFLGYPIGSLRGTISFDEAAPGVLVMGDVNLADAIKGSLSLMYSDRSETFAGSISGTLTIPDFSCHWVNVPCRVFKSGLKRVVTLPCPINGVNMDVNLKSDENEKWSGFFRGMVKVGSSITAAAQLSYFNEDWDFLFGPNYGDLYQIGEAAHPSATERPVLVAVGTPEVIFAVARNAESGEIPAIHLQNPAGQTITPENVGQHPEIVYTGDAENGTSLFWIQNPQAGTWILGVDNFSAADATFQALAPIPPPQPSFSSVTKTGDSVAIQIAVAPTLAGTKASVYFAMDSSGLDAIPIALDLPASSGKVDATWDTSEVAAGTYYIVAKADDGKNPPVSKTHSEPVTINRGNLLAPSNLRGAMSGTSITLNWTPSASPEAAAHAVFGTDAPEVAGYRFSLSAQESGTLVVEELDETKAYRFVVAAYDSAGNMGPCSSPVTVRKITVPGDCNGDGIVSIGEVQKAINMFLGAVPADCGVDCNGDGAVSIGELQKVINAFLGLAASC